MVKVKAKAHVTVKVMAKVKVKLKAKEKTHKEVMMNMDKVSYELEKDMYIVHWSTGESQKERRQKN